jgi:hypothetical protein
VISGVHSAIVILPRSGLDRASVQRLVGGRDRVRERTPGARHPAGSDLGSRRRAAREIVTDLLAEQTSARGSSRRRCTSPSHISVQTLIDAARSLGAGRSRLLADVHLLLLRPLGGDTLAIAVWEATKESRFEVAALPALLIVAVGLVPVVFAVRLARERG